MPRKILIAHDGSKGGAKALTAAITFAKQFSAELHMICVEEPPRFPATIDEIAEEKEEANHRFSAVVAKVIAETKQHRIKLATQVVTGHAVVRIVEAVERDHFDLLVVGYMGHATLYNRLIGSITDRLVELAPCSVLVVK